MRICILTRADLFPSNHGAAVKIVKTAEHLSNTTGQPCFIVTSDRDFYWRIEHGIHQCAYSKRSRARQEWLFVPQMAKVAERLCRQIGYPEEEHFLYTPQFDPAWVLRAVSVGLKEDIDVFQAEFPGYGVVAALASRIISFLRLGHHPISSIVQHNVEWVRLEEFGHQVARIRQMECLALRMVDEVIAVSQQDKIHMTHQGIPKEKITVIPHGVDCRSYQDGQERGAFWRKHWGIDADEVVVFFHGTLHYWPNTEAIRFLVERVIPLLETTLAQYRVVITGMNPPRYYEHHRVLFTDVVEDLAGHIHMADICVCPLFAGGGTRLKLLEYMAAGKAIVSTKKGAEGIPDCGQMWYAETPEEFQNAIVGLLEDDATRSALQQAAVRYASQLDWSRVTEAYCDLYSGLLRGVNWVEKLRQQVDPEAFLPSRKPSKPLTMLLLLNNGCNLRCSFCDLWEHHEHMPMDTIPELLNDAQRIGTKTVVITGGEPFLHPGLFEVIKQAKDCGLTVNVTTNGTLVERHWEALIASEVDSLSFSLDGIGEIHDDIRGQVGCFERTKQALQKVAAQTSIQCNVYFVVTNRNVHQLVDVFELARQCGAGFDFWPVNDAEQMALKTEKEQKLWRKGVAQIIQRDPSFATRLQFYQDGLSYHQGDWDQQVRCLGFVDQYGVTYKGELLPCCVWQGKGLVKGNIFERSLHDLWFSEEIQQYRKELVEQGCSVGCFNHSLYEFTESTGLPFRM